uniref:Snurportin-1 n=1 Tax=Strigamia maritima TaxID=126957 RepID=T1JE87_STRMM
MAKSGKKLLKSEELNDNSNVHYEDGELEAITARIQELQKETSKLMILKARIERHREKTEFHERSIIIGNINYRSTTEELRRHFVGCGVINRVTILANKDGRSKGFAFLEFANLDSVEVAMALDGSLCKGRKIDVKPKGFRQRQIIPPSRASTSTTPPTAPSSGQNTPKGENHHRANVWSNVVEDAYRFQVAGFKDENEYKETMGVTEVDRWPNTGFVKKLQRRDGMYYYFDKERECPEQEVGRVKLSRPQSPADKNDVNCQNTQLENDMDALTEILATSFQVTQYPNNPHAQHPRFSQYKVKQKNDQSTRRERLLEEQKQQRDKYVNSKRNLNNIDHADDDNTEEQEPMQWQQSKKQQQQQHQKKKKRDDRLMLSEWLVQIPDDLTINWYFMPCPVGRRCVVTTYRGLTKAHSRSGYFLKQFSSHLPGGNKQQEKKSGKQFTSLDCVYSEIERTFYVLDVMCWTGHPVYDSETEFRFYWMNSKLAEIPEISVQSKINQFKFVALQYFEYSSLDLHRVMSRPMQFKVDLDGILFYHKQTHYTCGPTPLVNWLKAYMIPEVLDVQVMDKYLEERPADYKGITQLKQNLSAKNKEVEVEMDL